MELVARLLWLQPKRVRHVHRRSCHLHNRSGTRMAAVGDFNPPLSLTTRSTPLRTSKPRFLPSQGSLSTTSSRICHFLRVQTLLVSLVYLASPTSPQGRSTTNNGTTMMMAQLDAVPGRITKTKSTQSCKTIRRILTSRWKRRMYSSRRGRQNE